MPKKSITRQDKFATHALLATSLWLGIYCLGFLIGLTIVLLDNFATISQLRYTHIMNSITNILGSNTVSIGLPALVTFFSVTGLVIHFKSKSRRKIPQGLVAISILMILWWITYWLFTKL